MTYTALRALAQTSNLPSLHMLRGTSARGNSSSITKPPSKLCSLAEEPRRGCLCCHRVVGRCEVGQSRISQGSADHIRSAHASPTELARSPRSVPAHGCVSGLALITAAGFAATSVVLFSPLLLVAWTCAPGAVAHVPCSLFTLQRGAGCFGQPDGSGWPQFLPLLPGRTSRNFAWLLPVRVADGIERIDPWLPSGGSCPSPLGRSSCISGKRGCDERRWTPISQRSNHLFAEKIRVPLSRGRELRHRAPDAVTSAVRSRNPERT